MILASVDSSTNIQQKQTFVVAAKSCSFWELEEKLINKNVLRKKIMKKVWPYIHFLKKTLCKDLRFVEKFFYYAFKCLHQLSLNMVMECLCCSKLPAGSYDLFVTSFSSSRVVQHSTVCPVHCLCSTCVDPKPDLMTGSHKATTSSAG